MPRARLTLPGVGPGPWWELPGVLAVCVAVAFLRTAGPTLRGAVWAEDATVFLQHAYDSTDLGLTVAYAGYLHPAPRLIAGVVEQFPLAWHGVLICLGAVLCQALLGTFAYHVVRAHAPARIAASITALSVVGVPVGPETIGNVANLQWFLLFAGCLAPLARPRTGAGWAAAGVVLVLTAASSPFGAVPVALAGIAWFATRLRGSLLLFLAGGAGLLTQVYGILTAPPRPAPVGPGVGVDDLVSGYVARILGDGVLGWSRHGNTLEMKSLGPWAGLLVLAVVIALVAVVWLRTGLGQVGLALVLLGLALVLWLPPIVISHVDTAYVVVAGRYHVAPVLCLLTACGLLIERVWLLPSEGRPAKDVLRVVSAGLAGALLVGIAYGQLTTWGPSASFFRRTPGVPWADQVRQVRTCAADPTGVAIIRAEPPGWNVRVPCRLFE